MNFKTTVVLMVLVAAAGLLLWLGPALGPWSGLTPRPADAKGEGTPAVLKNELTRDKVSRLEVNQGDQQLVFQRDGGEWTLEGNWPTRKQPGVEELVSLLTDLQPRFAPEPLTDANPPKKYGLDEPAVTVTAKAGDKEYRLQFAPKGDPRDTNRAAWPTYLRLAEKREGQWQDKGEVVRLAPDVIGVLRRPVSYYQKRELFESQRVARKDNPQDREQRLEAETIVVKMRPDEEESKEKKPGEEKEKKPEPMDKPEGAASAAYTLTKVGDDWQLTEPYRDRPVESKVHDILTALPDVWVEEFVPRPKDGKFDLGSYGLGDLPARSIAVSRRNRPTRTLLIGSKAPAPSGSRDPSPLAPPGSEAEYRYAKLQDNDQVFVIRTTKLKQSVFVPFADLRDASVVASFRTPDARKVELVRGSEKLVFEYDTGTSTWQLKEPLQVEAERSQVEKLLTELSNLRAENKDDVVYQKDPKYGLDAPAGRITVTLEEEKKPGESEGKTKQGEPKVKKPRTFTVLLGKEDDKDKDSFYVAVEGSERVTRVKGGLPGLVKGDLAAFRSRHVLDLSAGDLTRVEVQRGGETYALGRKDGAWQIVEPFEAPIAAAQASQVTAQLATLDCERYEPKADKDPAAYGLDKPHLRLTLTAGEGMAEKKRVLEIGKEVDESGGSRFARLGGDSAVFVLGSKAIAAVDRGALDLLDRQVLGLKADDIERVRGKDGATTLVLERKDGGWQVVESPAVVPYPADREQADRLLDVWAPLLVQRFAAYGAKADLAQYGLDKPAAAVTVTLKKAVDGKAVEHTLALGKPVEDGSGARYARLDKEPGVLVLSASDASGLTQSYLDFVDRTVLKLEAGDITALLRRGGEPLEIVKRDEGWQIVAPAEQRADDKGMQDLLAQLANLRAQRIAAYPAKDLKPFGLEEPAATVTLRLAGAEGKAAERVLQLGKVADEATGDRFAQVAGSQVVAVLPGRLSRLLTAGPLAFRDRGLARFSDADRAILERGPRKAVFAKVDGTWKLVEPIEAPAEQNDLEDLINAVARLRADELVAEKPGDLKPYGLDRPEARWRFQSGDRDVLSLVIGGPEKEGPRRYAKLAAGGLVFLLDAPLTGRLLAEYRQRTAWPAPPDAAQVEALTYRTPHGSFTLQKVDNTWQAAGKSDLKLNAQTVNETLAALAGLRVARYVQDRDADLNLYGLEPPELVLEIETPIGRRVLHVGRPEGESRRYYARIPDKSRPGVFVIAEADAERVVRDLAAFTREPSSPTKPAP